MLKVVENFGFDSSCSKASKAKQSQNYLQIGSLGNEVFDRSQL